MTTAHQRAALAAGIDLAVDESLVDALERLREHMTDADVQRVIRDFRLAMAEYRGVLQ